MAGGGQQTQGGKGGAGMAPRSPLGSTGGYRPPMGQPMGAGTPAGQNPRGGIGAGTPAGPSTNPFARPTTGVYGPQGGQPFTPPGFQPNQPNPMSRGTGLPANPYGQTGGSAGGSPFGGSSEFDQHMMGTYQNPTIPTQMPEMSNPFGETQPTPTMGAPMTGGATPFGVGGAGMGRPSITMDGGPFNPGTRPEAIGDPASVFGFPRTPPSYQPQMSNPFTWGPQVPPTQNSSLPGFQPQTGGGSPPPPRPMPTNGMPQTGGPFTQTQQPPTMGALPGYTGSGPNMGITGTDPRNPMGMRTSTDQYGIQRFEADPFISGTSQLGDYTQMRGNGQTGWDAQNGVGWINGNLYNQASGATSMNDNGNHNDFNAFLRRQGFR